AKKAERLDKLRINRLNDWIKNICSKTKLEAKIFDETISNDIFKLKIELLPILDAEDVSGTELQIMQFVKNTLIKNNIQFDEEAKTVLDNIEACEHCKNILARYKLTLQEDIKCYSCKYLKYKKNGIIMTLCNTECKNLYLWPAEYFSGKND